MGCAHGKRERLEVTYVESPIQKTTSKASRGRGFQLSSEDEVDDDVGIVSLVLRNFPRVHSYSCRLGATFGPPVTPRRENVLRKSSRVSTAQQ